MLPKWIFALAGLAVFVLVDRGLAQPSEVKPPTRSEHFQRREFTGKDGSQLSYWLMSPATVEPGKKYPLVLALHGRGGNTQAATTLASDELRMKYPCFVMAPAVPQQSVWAVPADSGRLRGRQMLPTALEALERLKADQPIDHDRVYVTGQSMGGFGTFGALSMSPQTFAAAIPICGGWDPKDSAKMKDVPLWVFHGDADPTVPVQQSRQMVEAVKQAGGTPIYTEYAGVRHDSWTSTYSSPETWQWLFAQKRSK